MKMIIELETDNAAEILRACHQCTTRYCEIIQRQFTEYKSPHMDYVKTLINGINQVIASAQIVACELKKQQYVNVEVVDSFIQDMNKDLARAQALVR